MLLVVLFVCVFTLWELPVVVVAAAPPVDGTLPDTPGAPLVTPRPAVPVPARAPTPSCGSETEVCAVCPPPRTAAAARTFCRNKSSSTSDTSSSSVTSLSSLSETTGPPRRAIRERHATNPGARASCANN